MPVLAGPLTYPVLASAPSGPVQGEAYFNSTLGGLYIWSGSVWLSGGAPMGSNEPPGIIKEFAGITAPAGYLLCDGAAYSRSTYAALFAAVSITTTATTHATTTVDGIPSTTGMKAGWYVSGANIPAGATVIGVTSGVAILISVAASGSTVGGALVVSPYPLGDGSTTFNVPDSRGRVLMGSGVGTTTYDAEITGDTPKGWWKLNEASLTNAADSSTTADNGTYTGTYTLNQAGPIQSAASDTSVNFNAGLVTIPYNAVHDTQTPSVEMWVNPTVVNAAGGLYEKSVGAATNTGYLLFATASSGPVPAQLTFRVVDSGGTQYDCDWFGWGALNSGTWYHIVGSYDQNNLNIYLNGVLVEQTQIGPITVKTGSGGSRIGQLFSGAYFAGNYSEVAVYNYALTPTQILDHYRTAIPYTLGAVGGEEGHALSAPETGYHQHADPGHSHSATITDPHHNHTQASHVHSSAAHAHALTAPTGVSPGNIGASYSSSTESLQPGGTGTKMTASSPASVATTSVTPGNVGGTTATNTSIGTGITASNATNGASLQAGGQSTGHNNLQPYLAVNHVIKT